MSTIRGGHYQPRFPPVRAATADRYDRRPENCLERLDNKVGDFFAYDGETTNPARAGNWSVRDGVSALGNTTLQDESRSNADVAAYPMW
ncbi:hypothetical protein SAMN05444339_1175 [Loktanella atrilutea]|uniref:Uncharacterized protein n=1 Tax=Loktanella atrilutea TaxID=366533 RepID=A0A1M5F4L0_LOKAT|nr:hypothetical protein SAMN05444339_1175 [Loktanella atrilutea]